MGDNNESTKIILIQTRYFNQKVFTDLCIELNQESITDLNNIFSELVLNNLKKNDQEFDEFSNICEFFSAFKRYFEKSNVPICENFKGYLFRLCPNKDTAKVQTNVFFYHHWFDKQFENFGILPTSYLEIVLEKIWNILSLDNDAKFDLYLFLHHGDTDSYNKYNNLTIKKSTISFNNKNTTVETFHHSQGYPIWDLILDNKNICKDIKSAIDKEEKIEDWILSTVLPQKIDDEFTSFLKPKTDV